MKFLLPFFTTLSSVVALTVLETPATIVEVVDCSSVSTLSNKQRWKLSFFSYNKCCTTGDYNVLVTGTDNYPDSYMLTACGAVAELLYQNLDRYADNKEIATWISFETESAPPITVGASTAEQEQAGDDLGDGTNFAYAFSLQTWKAHDDEDPRPIIVEEIFHMMTQFGWGTAYPSLFGSNDFATSLMFREMARALCVHWIHWEKTYKDLGTQE